MAGSECLGMRWLSARLVMGHFTRVSQAISQVQRRPGKEQKTVQRRLRPLLGNANLEDEQ